MVENIDVYDFIGLGKCSSIEDLLGLSVFFKSFDKSKMRF
jgi:hypothetical protein